MELEKKDKNEHGKRSDHMSKHSINDEVEKKVERDKHEGGINEAIDKNVDETGSNDNFSNKSPTERNIISDFESLKFSQEVTVISKQQNAEDSKKEVDGVTGLPDDNEDFEAEYSELLGYKFNEKWELRDKNGEHFQFKKYDEKMLNQQRYEKIGEGITELIYKLMSEDYKLSKIFIPIDASLDEPRSFFFSSGPDEEGVVGGGKLLLLIHGSGAVRAGQWARSIIINDNLMDGSQIPYIVQGKEENYQIIILNGNLNELDGKSIRGSASPEEHASYVWQQFIVPQSSYKQIFIVAHSYGGQVVSHLVKNYEESFLSRVKAVALTDSFLSLDGCSKKIKTFFNKNARNWVASDLELDTPIKPYFEIGCPLVSAGHSEHVWTSTFSKDSVFKFFKQKLEDLIEIEKFNSEEEDLATNDKPNNIEQSDESDESGKSENKIIESNLNKEKNFCDADGCFVE